MTESSEERQKRLEEEHKRSGSAVSESMSGLMKGAAIGLVGGTATSLLLDRICMSR